MGKRGPKPKPAMPVAVPLKPQGTGGKKSTPSSSFDGDMYWCHGRNAKKNFKSSARSLTYSSRTPAPPRRKPHTRHHRTARCGIRGNFWERGGKGRGDQGGRAVYPPLVYVSERWVLAKAALGPPPPLALSLSRYALTHINHKCTSDLTSYF